MTNLTRLRMVNWTRVASVALTAVACGATEAPGPVIADVPAASGATTEVAAGTGVSTSNSSSSTTGSAPTNSQDEVTSTPPVSSTSSTNSGTTSDASGEELSATSTSSSTNTSTGFDSPSVGGETGTSTSTGTETATRTETAASTGTASETNTSTGGETDASNNGSTATAQDGEYNPDFVEFYGEDCEIPEPMDVNNPLLPDLFLGPDGMRMSKKSDWRCQRAYLKKAVEKYLHGDKPGAPDSVTGTVTKSSVAVHVEQGGKSIDFNVPISGIPAGADGPVPVMISLGAIGGVGSEGDTDFGKTIRDEGVAIMTYNHGNISSEVNRSGLFKDLYGNANASAQVAWAWGVSRIIDVLVTEKAAGRNAIIEPTAVGVTGCSRNGKGAFTIGAFDERIALGIPQESGTGGVAALRIVATSPKGISGGVPQTLASIEAEAPGWLRGGFDFTANVSTFPVDMHSMAAMYAPRGLLVLDNSRIGYLGAIAGHGSVLAAAEMYKALGVEKNVAYHGGNPDDPHGHCSFYKTQVPALQRAIRAHLTKTAAADGRMEPQPGATADKADWVDWQTPTLQ